MWSEFKFCSTNTFCFGCLSVHSKKNTDKEQESYSAGFGRKHSHKGGIKQRLGLRTSNLDVAVALHSSLAVSMNTSVLTAPPSTSLAIALHWKSPDWLMKASLRSMLRIRREPSGSFTRIRRRTSWPMNTTGFSPKLMTGARLPGKKSPTQLSHKLPGAP